MARCHSVASTVVWVQAMFAGSGIVGKSRVIGGMLQEVRLVLWIEDGRSKHECLGYREDGPGLKPLYLGGGCSGA